MQTWTQIYDPLGHPALSGLVAALPLLVLILGLAVFRISAAKTVPMALLAAIAVANLVFGMPGRLIASATVLSLAQGLLPCLILIGAIAFQRVLINSGRFELLGRSLSTITPDPRLQVVFIGFCYGALLEAIAGGGTPVVITVSMLVALGFNGFNAAKLCLLANSTPVAYGAVGLPFVYMAIVTGIPLNRLSQMVAMQIPFTALVVPVILVALYDGWRGVKDTWPLIAVVSVVFAATQLVAGFYLGPYLPDVLASVLAMVAFILVNKVWQPPPRETTDGVRALLAAAQPLSGRQVLDAWTPLVVLIVVIGFWGSPYGTKLLSSTDFPVVWPGLHEVVVRVYPVVPAPRTLAAIWNVNWLSGAGTGIVVAAAATALLTSGRRAPTVFAQALLQSLRQLKFALIVAVTIVMMAFIMNYGGLVTSIGIVVAGTGVLFPFFSAFIGGIGVFTTGSDTSSSLLFGGIQTTAAQQAGFPPILAAGTNISGGATFKMVSPLELAVATSAGGLAGREGDLFRALIPWTLGFCAFIGLIALLQAHVFAFVIP